MSRTFMRLLILGDSVPFPRPLRGQPLEATWPMLLRNYFPQADIWQRARPRGCIIDVQAELRNFTESLDRFDAVVVQTGIVDAAPRPYPFLAYKLIEMLLSYRRMRQFERFAHRRLLWAYGRPWVTAAEFERRATQILQTVGEAAAGTAVIFVAIAPPGKSIAAELPGIARNAAAYNRVLFALEKTVGRSGPLRVVDPYAGQEEDGVTNDDGHHLSLAGHRLVAAAVAAAMAGLIREAPSTGAGAGRGGAET